MNPGNINAVNAVILITLGTWGYFDSESATWLILVFFGVFLLVLTQGIRNENKVQTSLAAAVNLIVLLVQLASLKLQLGEDNISDTARLSIMTLSSLTAMFILVKGLIKNLKIIN